MKLGIKDSYEPKNLGQILGENDLSDAERKKFPRGVFPYEYEQKVVDPKDRQRLIDTAQRTAFHYHMANKGPHSHLDDEDRAYFHKKGQSSGSDFADAVLHFVGKYHDHPLSHFENEAAKDVERNPHDAHGAAYTYCDRKGIKIPMS